MNSRASKHISGIIITALGSSSTIGESGFSWDGGSIVGTGKNGTKKLQDYIGEDDNMFYIKLMFGAIGWIFLFGAIKLDLNVFYASAVLMFYIGIILPMKMKIE